MMYDYPSSRELPVSPRYGSIDDVSGSGNGGSGGADSWDNEEVPPSPDWKLKPDYWKEYHPHFTSENKGGETEEEEEEEDNCLVQKKGGVNELPNSQLNKYYFNIENSSAKSALESAWKGTESRKEIVNFLNDIDIGNLKRRNVKNFKTFKSLTELKGTKVRMLVRNRKEGQPDEIVAIFLRKDMDMITKSFSKQYKRNK